jgi:hypothetical protein
MPASFVRPMAWDLWRVGYAWLHGHQLLFDIPFYFKNLKAIWKTFGIIMVNDNKKLGPRGKTTPTVFH